MSAAITTTATEAAYVAQRMAVNLLAATSSKVATDDRVTAMTEAFRAWPVLCRRMALLEDMAPRTSDAGRDADEELMRRLQALQIEHGEAA